LKFIKSENFPDAITNLIRHFEHQLYGETSIIFPEELYGAGVRPDEWFLAVGNQAREHRPTILTMDDGIKENSVSIKAMRESGCSFVILARAWSREGLASFSWRIIKHWPDIVREATAAHDAGRQCRMEVALKRSIHTTNL
jgi:hypothetical protein